MTATIIHFPTYEERDALEFDRCGTSSYTRALDGAFALLPAMRSSKALGPLKGRAVAFLRLFERLAIGRPEMVEEFAVLDDGEMIELRDAAAEVASLLAAA